MTDQRPPSLFDVEEMEVSFGPQHPATHGVLRVQLKLDGERIVDAKPIIGYLHRGTEKLFETMAFPQCIPHTDRMDYVTSATNNQGFCVAMEKLLGITIPPRAAYIRMMLAELQRLASHLVWLATHAIDLGAITPFFYTFRERDAILDLFESYCGARLTLNTMKIGGAPFELPDGWVERCSALVDAFPGHIDEYEELLTNNRIWKRRTIGVGVVSPEDAIDWGLTGPPLRGSGVRWDIRRVFPYDRYDEIEFEIPIGANGDTYDRYLVRIAEMRQSVRILRQCLDRLPEGPVMAKIPKVLRARDGMAYGSVEAPKGELGYFIVTTDKATEPYRCRVRPPSFVNLQMLPEMVRGHLVADLVAVIGTLDIVLGEIDR
ncbi:MAG TPA: NADH-quinone oxidoreductase subunit D [Thermoanaerobaculales bacterium]|nr:NADH-quinone oxidoreductase subunit D [Thermoanaerobaculales bacterium]HPA82596.1 NADH-quinone oxidoreductase subunit D [Thermoanaerobaculales bacterium]HQL30745.1 NADH-quinone oxidoreductase subunit D [Thermoanaerobaculales bacterium]HQP43965.1 NADH-quinone oxidoreductase subunit D [Thermoanaerobaculales bacterium]